MSEKKVCKNCGQEFDPDDTRENNRCGEAYHPSSSVEVGESGSPEYDYSTVYKYPCCGALEFPQSLKPAYNNPPGCTYNVHVAKD